MDWYILVPVCLLAGALIGFTGGLLGIGGGLIAIPLLGLLFGMDQALAQGTALIMVLPAILLSVRHYNRRSKIDLRAALSGALSTIVFTWLGARLALAMDAGLLRLIYAVFVLLMSLYYFYQSHALKRRSSTGHSSSTTSPPVYANHRYLLLGAFAGTFGGVFGVGGSVLIVPFLVSRMGYSQTQAQALALSMVIPGTIVALSTYTWHKQADWLVGIPLALGSIALVPYGVRLAFAWPESRLRMAFACMLLLMVPLLLLSV